MDVIQAFIWERSHRYLGGQGAVKRGIELIWEAFSIILRWGDWLRTFTKIQSKSSIKEVK